jgi:ABC-2 type transport system permease protein
MGKIIAVAKKEIASFFASPAAFIFLGSFLLVTLFIFFWVEAFFARNIVDIRPLFEWMPALMIILVSAITMRMWSEERRMGTLEFVMTMPVTTWQMVCGKFFACLVLVALALFLTIGIPWSVSHLGTLDYGPVLGAYLASLLLASAYIAIGLFVSARSDNQIVALIGSVFVGSLFFLVGSDTLTTMFGGGIAETMGLFSTQQRFESITRGVLDLRDLFYYLSLAGVFLSLTVYSLERLKWASGVTSAHHTRWQWITLLLVGNLVLGNFSLAPARGVRADMTRGNQYSISQASKDILANVREPLLLRGYFSAQTHPLLAPLVPQIKDTLREYELAGNGAIRAEFVDPKEDAALEEEAGQKYAIKPMPFQVSEKYKESLVNSYFAILIEYGDQFSVLDFRDIIEVKVDPNGEPNVRLRNLEYDLTRAIKKTLYGFQSTDSLLASLANPVKVVGYISDQSILPDKLKEAKKSFDDSVADLQKKASGKLEVLVEDPQANGGQTAARIAKEYGIRPMMLSLFDPQQFFFYITLEQAKDGKKEVLQVPLPQEFTKESFSRSIEAGLKRFSTGFLKTVGVVVPKAPQQNPMMPYGQPPQGRQFQAIMESLRADYTVEQVSLDSGVVPDTTDLLMVLAPENVDAKQLFAIDQFLMKGGTVVLSTGKTGVKRTQTLMGSEHKSGLEEWLLSYGIAVSSRVVLDKANEPYPVPVRRMLGQIPVEEMQLVPYMMFPEVRGAALNADSGIVSGLNQVTMNWASPLSVKQMPKDNRTWKWLLKSSEESFSGDGAKVEPNFDLYGDAGFDTSGERGPFVMAGVMEGNFDSYFKGKDSPLLQKEEDAKPEGEEGNAEAKPESPITGIIDLSVDSARLIVFASNEFLTDEVLQLSAASGANRYLNTLMLMQNTVDWSLEDRSLLSIRGRSLYSQTLPPMEESDKRFWEYLNYVLVLIGLGAVFAVRQQLLATTRRRHAQLLTA